MRFNRSVTFAAISLLASMSGLTGCVYHTKETEIVKPAPSTVVMAQPSQRVYTYAEGRYELHGNGTGKSPYYWVWIPAGVQSVPVPPVPPIPAQ